MPLFRRNAGYWGTPNRAEYVSPGQEVGVSEHDTSARRVAGPRQKTRSAQAVGIEVADGILVRVVDEFEELPVTRSLEFLVAELRRPVGVYLGQSEYARDNTLLTALHLYEPLGYDVDRPTPVRVIVNVTANADGTCSIVFECRTTGRTAADGAATTGHPLVPETARGDDHVLPRRPAGVKAVSQPVELHTDAVRCTMHAMGIVLDDGYLLKIIDKNEQLPVTRSVELPVSDVKKPLLVYVVGHDAPVAELLLYEPAGYDGGLRTAIEVVVHMLVDTDGNSFVFHDCRTVRRNLATDGVDSTAGIVATDAPEPDNNETRIAGVGEDAKAETVKDEPTGIAEDVTTVALLYGQMTTLDENYGEPDVSEPDEITSPGVSMADGPDDYRLLLSSKRSADIQVDADRLGDIFTEPCSRCNAPEGQYNKPDIRCVESDGRCDNPDSRRHEPDGQCDESDGIESRLLSSIPYLSVANVKVDGRGVLGNTRFTVNSSATKPGGQRDESHGQCDQLDGMCDGPDSRCDAPDRQCDEPDSRCDALDSIELTEGVDQPSTENSDERPWIGCIQNIIIVSALALGGYTLYRLLN